MRWTAPADIHAWHHYFSDRARRSHDRRLQRYFETGLPAPDASIDSVPMVAMDMETTGLDIQRCGIVSLALVPFTYHRIDFANRRSWLIKPRRPLWRHSVTVHGITDQDIEQAPDLEHVLEEMLSHMAGRVVVVHYREIERPFLDAAVLERTAEPFRFPVIDTMELEARRHRFSRWAQFRQWLGRPLPSIRLAASRQRYGLPMYHGHNALTDALATAELLQAQLRTHYDPTTPLHTLWQ